MRFVPVILLVMNIVFNFDNVSGFLSHVKGDSNSFETVWTECDNGLRPQNKELSVEEGLCKWFKVTFPK